MNDLQSPLASLTPDGHVPPETDNLVHVDISPGTVRWPALYIVLTVGLLVAVYFIAGPGRSPGLAWAFALVTLVLLGVVCRRLVENRVGQIVEKCGSVPLATLVSKVFGGKPKSGIWGLVRVAGMVRALAKCNHLGQAIRLCVPKDARPITPFETVFEAQTLDQADATFRQLELLDVRGPGDLLDSPEADGDGDSTWLKVKRNVALRGGWIFAGISLIFVLFSAVISYEERRITGHLILWSAVFFLTLFGAAGATRSRKQWFAVPGGLIVRKVGLRGGSWRVRLFVRERSVLAAYPVRRRLCMVVVARKDEFERVELTRREADFVLRAWLSPLSPPAVEKLTDLH